MKSFTNVVLLAFVLFFAGICQAGETISRELHAALSESQIALENGDLVKTRRILREYMQKHQDEPHALVHFVLGNSWMLAGRPEKADAEYAMSLELDPDRTEVLSNRAQASWELGQFVRSAEMFERAFRLTEAKDYDTIFNAAAAWFQAGNQGRVVELLEPLLEESAFRRDWLELFCHALFSIKRPDRAIKAVEHFMMRDPLDAELWSLKAVLLQQTGDLKGAASALEVLYTIREPDEEDLRDLAGIYDWLGLPDRYAELLESIIPGEGSLDIRIRLADAWEKAGEPEKSLNWLDLALEDSFNASLVHKKVQLLSDAGRFDTATMTLVDAEEKGMDFGEAWLVLGRKMLAYGLFDEATHALTKASESRNGSDEADIILSSLRYISENNANGR